MNTPFIIPDQDSREILIKITQSCPNAYGKSGWYKVIASKLGGKRMITSVELANLFIEEITWLKTVLPVQYIQAEIKPSIPCIIDTLAEKDSIFADHAKQYFIKNCP